MSQVCDYKSLKELTKSLAKGIGKLESGKLGANELTNLLEDARALHERVAVLQYLAFDKEVKAFEKKIELKKPKKELKKLQRSFELNFGTLEIENETILEPLEEEEEEEIPPNQTNLLDAIEEHVDDVPVLGAEVSTKEELNTSTDDSKSINEQFANENEGKTLADKLSRQPISNLKEAIGLNQKFLFISDLFEGENTLYNDTIDTINSFENLEQAKKHIENDIASKLKWDKEHKSVKKFIDLVERRFMA